MTAITELAARAAPGRASAIKAHPGEEAGAGTQSADSGDFARLVTTAGQGSTKVPPAATPSGATAAPQPVPADVPMLGDDLVRIARPGAAPAGESPVDTTAGAPDAVTGKTATNARGKRVRPQQGEASVEGASRTDRPRRTASATRAGADLAPAIAEAGAAGPEEKAKPVSEAQLLAAIGTNAPASAPALASGTAPVPGLAPAQDASLAAAASLVALVAAQQAATPTLERRAARPEKVERGIAMIGESGDRAAATAPAAPAPVATGEAKGELPVMPAVKDTPLDPAFIAPPVGGKTEGRAEAPATPAMRAAVSRTEAIMADAPVAAAPARLFAIPAAPGTAEALDKASIDMSVQGQWIDRMAREITQLASGTGTSRFQLLPAQLGRIQVELAVGDAGTLVRMTAETDEAADRLRAGSAQLQADARMASIPLAGLVIDRAAAGGFDMGRDNGQSGAQQQSARQATDMAGQGGGQSGNQSSNQSGASSGEQRHKAGGRDAVLNERSDSDAGARPASTADRRVRFA